MKSITLTDEAMDLLFHSFNTYHIEPALKYGFGNLIREGERTSQRPLFGNAGEQGLHGEIMGQLINAETI